MQKNAILFVTFIILEASLVTRGLPHPGSNEDNLTAPESSQNPQAVPITQEMDVLNTEQLHIARQRNVQGGVVSTEPESSQSNDATASSKGIQKTEKKNYTSITPEMLHKDSNVCVKCGRAIGKECTHRSKQAVNLLCFVTSGLCYACDQVFGNGITRGLPYPGLGESSEDKDAEVCDTCGKTKTPEPQGASSSHEIVEIGDEEFENAQPTNVRDSRRGSSSHEIVEVDDEEFNNTQQTTVREMFELDDVFNNARRTYVRDTQNKPKSQKIGALVKEISESVREEMEQKWQNNVQASKQRLKQVANIVCCCQCFKKGECEKNPDGSCL
ncbi:uncharacterized protein LOC126843359 isoform X9 [Adelges cooleyi]|uniref:uncharacterized protein LOC126843359 isoform X9 n=1 Tax=Adelges cooleyi TaxID=133065 RepID=UPI00217FEDFB|nr:uncharacterized protein LOC126843359 isoform X9 [Adelges cooleyi]